MANPPRSIDPAKGAALQKDILATLRVGQGDTLGIAMDSLRLDRTGRRALVRFELVAFVDASTAERWAALMADAYR